LRVPRPRRWQTRYLLDGREFDSDTQLYYFRSRYYDPAAGRFLSPDSTGFKGGDSNLYRFVNNNPANLHDPRGTEFTQDDAINTQALSDSLSTWLTPEGINYATSYWTGGAATSTFTERRSSGRRVSRARAYAAFDFTILTAVDAMRERRTRSSAEIMFRVDPLGLSSTALVLNRDIGGNPAVLRLCKPCSASRVRWRWAFWSALPIPEQLRPHGIDGTDYYQLGASAFDAFTAVDGVKGSVKGLLESKSVGHRIRCDRRLEKNANALRGLKYLTGDGAAADLSLGLGE